MSDPSILEHTTKKSYELSIKGFTDETALTPMEKMEYDNFIKKHLVDENLTHATDIVQLNLCAFNYIRLLRLSKIIVRDGDVSNITKHDGSSFTTANPASGLFSNIQSQLRADLVQLGMTRKERVKKEIGIKAKEVDFTELIDVDL